MSLAGCPTQDDARKTLVSRRIGGGGEEIAVAAEAYALVRWALALDDPLRQREMVDTGTGHRGETRLAAERSSARRGTSAQ